MDVFDIRKIKSNNKIKLKDVPNFNSNVDYTIINYDATVLCSDDYSNRKINTIVTHKDEMKILSIGPALSLPYEIFKNDYPEINDNFLLETMIEGLSFQLFYDSKVNKWEMSTKNSVSGNYSYYKMPKIPCYTYRQMVLNAMKINENSEFENWEGIKYMNKNCCYHFILQHPKNHIVLNITNPALYYIGRYELKYNDAINELIYIPHYTETIFPTNFIFTPTLYQPKDITYENCLSHFSDLSMGISIIEKKSYNRCFILTPSYEELKNLRGSHPNLMYQYLCVFKSGKISDYLKYFPQYKNIFWEFHILFENLIKKVHSLYFDIFILKQHKKIDNHFYYHIKQIHNNIYKASLQEVEPVVIKKHVVREYIKSLEPGFILHLLQHEKYKLDKII